MLDPNHPLSKLLKQDTRYKFEAYAFVFESLNYAQEKMGLGQEQPTEEDESESPAKRKEEPTAKHKEEPAAKPKEEPAAKRKEGAAAKRKEGSPAKRKGKTERHMTGQQLCEAIRQYASEQFGLMAKAVLNSWGVQSTGDIGNIVFNLIEIGQMRKTKQDSRSDFENVFDFETVLVREFKITPAPAQTEGS
ncbi:MAG TPA: Minf_1886 family protein [Pirellulales bacterium]|nr:Minf_1886 family protein [Pirellulales bacterium]